jgi:hypothetical protein
MAHPETVFGCAFHLQEKLGNEKKKNSRHPMTVSVLFLPLM